MARFRLIPREEKFYDDFIALAEQLRVGAGMLEDMLSVDPPKVDRVDEIKEIEHKCDFITHQVIQRLNRTFVTPMDREDIHALAKSLDDVMDAIDAAAALVRIYRIDKQRFGGRELARVIVASTDGVCRAMQALERKSGVEQFSVEINRLENEADRIYQQALSQLFQEERDPIAIIKWKEMLDYLEAATDRCEDVANVLESVAVKHA